MNASDRKSPVEVIHTSVGQGSLIFYVFWFIFLFCPTSYSVAPHKHQFLFVSLFIRKKTRLVFTITSCCFEELVQIF